jgi:hypothetical protein
VPKFKRPCYIVEQPTGVMVLGPGDKLVEATIRIGIKQTAIAAETLKSQYTGAIVTKGFVEAE